MQTKHENYINDCQVFVRNEGNGDVQMISTSDPNGSLHYWDTRNI